MYKSNKHFNSLYKASAFILLIISVLSSLTACGEKAESGGNPELTPYSEEIYVSGEWLYYDGPRRDAGLFAYNLETGEKVKITEQQGTLLKTAHGFYYSVGMKVYEINGLSLELLCVIPKEAVWADYNNGKAYWYGADEVLYAGGINAKKWILEESVQKLYQSSADNYIWWVKILDDRAYVGQKYGLNLVDFETLETKCIWDGKMTGVFFQSFDTEYLFVQSLEGDNYERCKLYMVSAEGVIQKIDDVSSDFALVQDGTIYYNGGGMMAYDLEDGSKRRLGNGDWTCTAAFYDHYIILRHGAVYSIGLFDILDGTLEWIIQM